MISALSAAKTLCEISGWSTSNLQIQKILYFAQMLHLGRTGGGDPLINSAFEAWDYGPVIPKVYQEAKVFGSSAVGNVFHTVSSVQQGRPERDSIVSAWSKLQDKTPGQLVAITHWDQGAWALHYHPGIKGIRIPNEDILDEYRRRTLQH